MSSRKTTTTTTTSSRRATSGSTKKAAPPPPPKPSMSSRRGSKKEEEVTKKETVKSSSTTSTSRSVTPPPVSPRIRTLPAESSGMPEMQLPISSAATRASMADTLAKLVPDGEESETQKELRRQLAEAEEESNLIKQEIRDKCQAAMDTRQREMTTNFEYHYNNTIKGMEDCYTGRLKGQIDNMQTDVLRTNKIFREIGRGLGDEWPSLFRTLMKDVPTTVTENAIDRIQCEYRPYMQPYNALVEWKRQMAEDFYLQPLIESLRADSHYDLANRAMDIMETRGEGLMKLEGLGRGLASGTRPRPPSIVANGDNAVDVAAAIASATPDVDARDALDPLNDASLLKLARKLGEEWPLLADPLQVQQEDLEVLIANVGTNYSGGFRMLWNWRDSLGRSNDDESGIMKLTNALSSAGFTELANEFQRMRAGDD